MKIILIVVVILLSGCSASAPQLDPAKVEMAFQEVAKSFKTVEKQHNQLVDRVLELEKNQGKN